MLCPSDTLGDWVGKTVKAYLRREGGETWKGVLVSADSVGIRVRFRSEEDFLPWRSLHHLVMEDG